MYLDVADPRYKAYAASQGRDAIAQAVHDCTTWDTPLLPYIQWLGTTRTAWDRMRRMDGQDADGAAFERWLAGRFPARPVPARRIAA